jgi:hypothetical protein
VVSLTAKPQNLGTDARAFASLARLSSSSYRRAAGSSNRTVKLLRTKRIAPSLRCHIPEPGCAVTIREPNWRFANASSSVATWFVEWCFAVATGS